MRALSASSSRTAAASLPRSSRWRTSDVEEERVTLGGARDRVEVDGLGAATGELRDEPARVGGREAPERQAAQAGAEPGGELVGGEHARRRRVLRAHGRDQQQPRRARAAQELGE